MPILHEPVAADTAALLRRAVLRLRTGERPRVFGPVVHVGRPGGHEATYDVRADAPLDHALRCDLVAAMLRRVDDREGAALLWLTRMGELAPHDADAAWLAAGRAAYAEAGRSLTMVVVTRQGWWDPRGDVRRVWKRLRER